MENSGFLFLEFVARSGEQDAHKFDYSFKFYLIWTHFLVFVAGQKDKLYMIEIISRLAKQSGKHMYIFKKNYT